MWRNQDKMVPINNIMPTTIARKSTQGTNYHISETCAIEEILDLEVPLPRAQSGEICYAVMAGAVRALERAKEHPRAIGYADRVRAACESHNDENCRSLASCAEMTALEALGSWKAWDWMKRWALNEGGRV